MASAAWVATASTKLRSSGVQSCCPSRCNWPMICSRRINGTSMAEMTASGESPSVVASYSYPCFPWEDSDQVLATFSRWINRNSSRLFCVSRNRRAFSKVVATLFAIPWRVSTSCSLNAASCFDCTSRMPMTRSATIRGRAISDRVSGRSGFSKRTGSEPTSRAMRAWRVVIAVPTILFPPTGSRWPRNFRVWPAVPVASFNTAHCPESSTRKIAE